MPYHATDFFLYPLKTLENPYFSDVLGGSGCLDREQRHEIEYAHKMNLVGENVYLLPLTSSTSCKRQKLFLCPQFFIHDCICGALRDLAPFIQFKKREKHPWRSVNFSKVAG